MLLARASSLRTRPISSLHADAQQILALSAQTSNRYHYFAAQFLLADLAERERNYDLAISIATKAAADARREGLPVLSAAALSELGYAFVYQRRRDLAVPVLREAVQLAERSKNYATLATARLRLGEALIGTPEADSAVEIMRPAIEWFRQAGNSDALPFLLIKWGTAHKPETAAAQRQTIFEEALALAEKNGDPFVQSVALQRLSANVTFTRPGLSLQYSRKALPLAWQVGNHGFLMQIAGTFLQAGEVAPAAEIVDKLQPILESYKPGPDRAHFLSRLHQLRAAVSRARGDCTAALAEIRHITQSSLDSRLEAARAHACLPGAPSAALRSQLASAERWVSQSGSGPRDQVLARLSTALLARRLNLWPKVRSNASAGLQLALASKLNVDALELCRLLQEAEQTQGNPSIATRCQSIAAGLGLN